MGEEQISQKTFDEISAQLKFLKTVKRREIANAVNEAREHGDLKENSGYHEARKDQSLNEAKIRELEKKIDSAKVVEEATRTKGVVSLRSQVKFKNLETDEIKVYTLVSELESDILENKVSASTPVGDALLGAKVGETVEVIAPLGIMKFKILEIT
ncbi:MAG: transcription elongation factor GreA [Candidatus Margulisiibacteriota bacterium]